MRKLFTLLILLFTLAGSSWGQNGTTSVSHNPAKKVENRQQKHAPNPVIPMEVLQGGETISTATLIPSLPYSDIGTTVGYADDYEGDCEWGTSAAPDVVYKYTPAADAVLNISLCNDATDYDTKLFVFDTPTPVTGDEIACSDDMCSTILFPADYVSEITGLAVTAGTTYYIVVDGYDVESGAYEITVEESADPIPPNDDCSTATPVSGPFPQTVAGTTLGATVDCPGILNWNGVWYAISLPYALNNLTVDWCGTENMSTVGVVYYTTCPVSCGDYSLYTSNTWQQCGNPVGAITALTSFEAIPGPASIYYIAYSLPQMDHVITFDVTELSCPTPTSPVATPGLNSALLDWTENGTAISWDIEYGQTPYLFTGNPTITGIGKPYDLPGLSQGTEYAFKIRATCGAEYSEWSVTEFFTTLCDPISLLPWNEGFESAALGSVPTCWNRENGEWGVFNNSSSTYDADAHSGTQFLRETYGAINEYVWTPGFTLNSGISYNFSFWWAGDNYNGWTGDVFYNGIQNSVGATQLGTSFVEATEYATMVYRQEVYPFIPPVTGVYYFAIRVNEPSGVPWYLSFDDFSLDLTPECPPPYNLQASNIGITTADVDWDLPVGYNIDSFFDIYYDISPFDPETEPGTLVSGITATEVTLEGLTGNSTYDVYARSVCQSFVNPKVDYWWASINADYIMDYDNSGATPVDEGGETGQWDQYLSPQGRTWYNTWFYNGALDMSRMKIIRVGFWVQQLEPNFGDGNIYFVVNWSTPGWTTPPGVPIGMPGYPLPGDEQYIMRSPTNGPYPVIAADPINNPNGQWMELYYVIPDYNPEWVSIDIYGDNIIILSQPVEPPGNSPLHSWWTPGQPGGMIVHECLPKPTTNVGEWSIPVTFSTQCYPTTLPLCEFFDAAAMPACWTEQLEGLMQSDHWSISSSNLAGGTQNEAVATFSFPGEGVTLADNDRLISPAFNTTGLTSINLSYRQYLDDYNAGINDVWIKVQSSSDGINWTDEWVYPCGLGIDILPETKNLNIVNNLGDITWIAWTLSGNTYDINNWYIDDICLYESCLTNTWTGAISDAWNNPGNWSCGIVPNNSVSVILPAGMSFYPTIPAGVVAECYEINLEPGATFTVATGGTLNIVKP
jgi:hypothetical protein